MSAPSIRPIAASSSGAKENSVFKTMIKAAPVVLRDAMGLCGVAAVAYGSYLVYEPAGFIVGGLLVIGVCILSARA